MKLKLSIFVCPLHSLMLLMFVKWILAVIISCWHVYLHLFVLEVNNPNHFFTLRSDDDFKNWIVKLCFKKTLFFLLLIITIFIIAEILKQFLTPFDTLFEVFYNSLFSQHFENHQDASKLINSLICFLELLELLIASRIYLKLHFTCQRILFLKPSCVLDVITWPIQAFVKRKLIIFIKKCLLCKVGEDLCRGSVPAFMPPDNPLDVDLLALASAVLQAVNLGKRSCFGGGEVLAGYEHAPGPDHVILRALSLLIIRSLEIKFQNCASANEMKGNFLNAFCM